MMRSPMNEFRGVVTNKSLDQAPTIYNNIYVKRDWINTGSNSNSKNFAVIYYGRFKLAQCQNAYVLLCIEDGCKNLASSTDFKCRNHNKGKEVYKFCRNNFCIKGPSYGNEYKKPLFCNDHRLTDMYNVKHEKCKNCNKRPSFSLPGQKPEYCKDHKSPEMVDVCHKLCKFPDCIKHPNFGYKTGKAEYCKDHKIEEMIDVVHTQCDFPECDIRPIYGYKGRSARCCKRHKESGMVNIVDKKCEFLRCSIIPIFGNEGQTTRFCKKHKHDGMIDVKNKKCQFTECTRRPNFGLPGQWVQYCNEHKHNEMINLKRERCEFPECDISPSYGNLYLKNRIFCREHSSLNYYSGRKLNPICQVINCLNIAYFIDPTDDNIYPIRCHNHHHSTDIELIFKRCSNCEEELYFPEDKEICMNCGNYRERILYHFKETPCPA